ncbi:MAG: hypothetical protein WCC08_12015 [Terrimicrobiaceae bacterium]
MIRELVRIEKFALTGRPERLVCQEGEHCSSVVCENTRSLTRIDPLRAEDRHGFEDGFLGRLFPERWARGERVDEK